MPKALTQQALRPVHSLILAHRVTSLAPTRAAYLLPAYEGALRCYRSTVPTRLPNYVVATLSSPSSRTEVLDEGVPGCPEHADRLVALLVMLRIIRGTR